MGSHTINTPVLYCTLLSDFVLVAWRMSSSTETCSSVKIKEMVVLFDVIIRKCGGRWGGGVQWEWYCFSCECVALQSASHLKNLTTVLTTFTAWSRVLFEKVIGSQLVKKFPAFYGTRMLITTYAQARHLYLFWARLYQRIRPSPRHTRMYMFRNETIV